MSRHSTNQTETPKQLGYSMLAEWEHHEATWLAWPHNKETWPGRLREIENIYVQVIEALSTGEKVRVLVNDALMEEKARALLSERHIKSSQVEFLKIATQDAWIRDYGPNFILKRDPSGNMPLALNRWIFNAWGAKYKEHLLDDVVAEHISALLGIPLFKPGIVLEGGAVDVNGKGSMLATEECLLNSNRNPNIGKKEMESCLCDYLGVSHVIWLERGIAGDDTDGHIDEVARFVGPSTVVCSVEKDGADENADILRANLAQLQRATDQDGKKINVIQLPMPGKVIADGIRLPASYANFYIGNQAVLIPVFGGSSDAMALGIFKDLFPKRAVIGIRCESLIYGLGGIHCITHEQPAAV